MRSGSSARTTCRKSNRPTAASTAVTAVVLSVLGASASAQRQFDPLGGGQLPFDRDNTRTVALGDVDGDGDLDILCGNARAQNRLFLNDGQGTFVDATVGRMPADADYTKALVLGDADADGDLDIAVGNTSYQQNRLYLNNGSGFFSDQTVARMPYDHDLTEALAFGDVDGDGDLDLVSGNRVDPNRILINDGRGYFIDGTPGRLPVARHVTHAVALGDVDSDGDLDLVVGNIGQNELFLNDGHGRFADVTGTHLPALGDGTLAIALGDVDADGDLDVVFGNSPYLGPSRNRLHLNDGSGTFTDVSATHLPHSYDYTIAVALGDVDGDGDLDLATGSTGQDRLYVNDGSGVFSDVTAARMPVDSAHTPAIALGDVDGDEDLDLFCGESDPNPYMPGPRNRLELNLLRQLEAPSQPRIGHVWQLDVYARYGPSSSADFAFPFLSAGSASIPLPPFGTFRLDPTRLLVLPPVFVPQPAGSVPVLVQVPSIPSLQNGVVHSQALLLHQPVQAVLTNSVQVRIGV